MSLLVKNSTPLAADPLSSADPLLQTAPSRRFRQVFSLERMEQVTHRSFCAYTLCAAVSIAASQIVLGLALAFWLLTLAAHPQTLIKPIRSSFGQLFAAAILTWFFVSLCSSLVGLYPGRGIFAAVKAGWILTLPLCVASSLTCAASRGSLIVPRLKTYLICFIAGQSFAAVHSVFSAAAGVELAPRIPGPVTESGQLVLILPLLAALAAFRSPVSRLASTLREILIGGLLLLLITMAWPSALTGDPAAQQLIVKSSIILLLIAGAAAAIMLYRSPASRGPAFEILTAALLLTALIVNLKRGPWVGVAAAVFILSLAWSMKILIRSSLIALCAFAALEPVRARLGSLVDHFVIQGGRQSMWSIGVDLIQRFPLGLGLNNAQHMREIDPSLPLLHRHMHNNLLNVAVETGWIGLAAYLWWMTVVFTFGFSIWMRCRSARDVREAALARLAICVTCALVGWQISGLVEYNFGDAEIQLIALFYMGIILAVGTSIPEPT